jgi:hypothetical protein
MKQNPKLTITEKMIVEARCGENKLSIANMDERFLNNVVVDMVIRAAAITGCALPNTKEFAKTVNDEVKIYLLNFGFEKYTAEEVLLAFRLNAHGQMKNSIDEQLPRVTLFGECFNVTFLSCILSNYSGIRNVLDRKLQNHIDNY